MSHDLSAGDSRSGSRLQPLKTLARVGIEETIGLLPLLEGSRRLTRAGAARRIRVLEDAEVERLAGFLGRTPEAKVTTVVPTYRRPELLVAAVDSALVQTETDQTVFVVSDGDDLPPLPRDDRVVAVRLSRNIGVPGAVRNVAIRLSRSPFVAFLDDDNRWLPHHLATCLAVLGARDTFAYAGIRRVLPNGRTFDEVKVGFDRRRLRNENYIDMNAVVVRRGRDTIFSRLPRPRGTFPLEDWEFAWRQTGHGASFVDDVTVEWLINPESRHWPEFHELAHERTRRPDVAGARAARWR